VGTTSAAQSFQLTNTGMDDLTTSGTVISGPFNLLSNTCKTTLVAPGSACTYKITFTPTAVGPVGGSFTINDNAYGSPSQTITLNGTGQ
jgi:hypothetical protein